MTKVGIWKFLKKYRETGTIARQRGSGRPCKITREVLAIVEEQMRKDDETTAVQLQRLLAKKNHPLSLKTILRFRSKLGWPFRGSAYCQLIRDANKFERLNWAKERLEDALENNFKNVLWDRRGQFPTGNSQAVLL